MTIYPPWRGAKTIRAHEIALQQRNADSEEEWRLAGFLDTWRRLGAILNRGLVPTRIRMGHRRPPVVPCDSSLLSPILRYRLPHPTVTNYGRSTLMKWMAPSEKDTGTETLENSLRAAADRLRANSGLTSTQYCQSVLSLIFLRLPEVRFLAQRGVEEAGGQQLCIFLSAGTCLRAR